MGRRGGGHDTDRVSLVQTTGVGGKGVCLLGKSSDRQSTLVFTIVRMICVRQL